MTENNPDETDPHTRTKGPPKLTLVSSHVDDSAGAPTGEPAGKPISNEEHAEKLRIIEALLFAAPEPVSIDALARHLNPEDDVDALLIELQKTYATRGINLVKVADKWTFRTAKDMSYLLRHHAVETRRLSKAALETLAIIAYHQPVTRAEIEEIRGVTTSVGTLDILLETAWVRLRGRRRAPGRPVTYGTSDAFLSHFGLENIKDLPGLAELKGTGLLTSDLPPNFQMPQPTDVAALMPDELPLEDDGEDEDQDDIGDEHEPDTDDNADLSKPEPGAD